MAYAEWDVLETPANEKPFAAVLRHGDKALFTWPADTRNESEAIILNAIEAWQKAFKKGGAALMPKGPRGEKRPADAIGLAVMVGRIATGEIEDERDPIKSAAAELGSRGGKKRAENMTPERRREIAQAAAQKRWEKD
jgi:hypothetical protein